MRRTVRTALPAVLASTLLATTVLAATGLATPAAAARPDRDDIWSFRRVASFSVYRNAADPAEATVAEIVAATDDGRTLVYTDSEQQAVGFVDIADPGDPQPDGRVDLDGTPTSVAVLSDLVVVAVDTSESFTDPSGHLAVLDLDQREVVTTIHLAGQPDSVKASPDGRYVVVVIENQRDEDVEVDGVEGGLPQAPAGLLQIVDVDGEPGAWTVREVDLTGIADVAPDDPEPELVDVNDDDLAVVTLQENNHVVFVDLEEGEVVRDLAAGTVDVEGVDVEEDGVIDLTGSLDDVPREPDGVAWLDDDTFAIANEGDLDGGSRGFSIMRRSRKVLFDSGNLLERLAVTIGHHPDDRAENKGVEPEGIAFGEYGRDDLLFVGAERGNFVSVFDVHRTSRPELLQVLPTAIGPEGILPIPDRDLLVVTSEVDDPPFGIRTAISIYEWAPGEPTYPQLVSDEGDDGPIGWGAISGLAGDPDDADTLYAVSDSAYATGRLYTVDTGATPAVITGAIDVEGGGDVDLEGVTVAPDGSRWLASEGNASDSRPNRLLQVDEDGEVVFEVGLPAEVLACRAATAHRASLGAGFEGVAAVPAAEGDGYVLVVAQQRGWDYTTPECEALDDDPTGDDPGEPGWTRLWSYDPATGEWAHRGYQLEPLPAEAGWVGLSEVSLLPDGRLAVVERDDLTGDFAALKWLAVVDAGDDDVTRADKSHADLLDELRAGNGWIGDKLEGATLGADGQVYVVTDNDGLDGSTGETQFLRLGDVDDLDVLGPEERDAEVQVLAINDFHGNLLPPTGSSGRVGTVDAGGAEFLATHVADLRATNPASVVVSAGDLIGASPLLSALFHDEPTVEAMNHIGLDLNAVGNHEFDEGVAELRRMQDGGCHPVDGCLDGDGFAGADFGFLAANVVDEVTREPLFPAYAVEELDGVDVAFVGMTLEGTPTIVSAAGVAGWDFLDEADTVNALVPELRAAGVEAIVVLLHEGGVPASFDIDGCAGISGPIVDIVERMDDAVDLVVSGHTHQPYNCVIDGTPVTAAFSFGRLVTDIDLRVSRSTGDVTSVAIDNRIVTRDVSPDPAISALLDKYQAVAGPIANRTVGAITADLLRAAAPSGEQTLGDVVADAQLAATGADVAFMNPGGIRADLTFAGSPAGEGDGVVTFGEVFTVQPFGNALVTLTLTGAQLERLLEEQFCGINSPANGGFSRILSPSAGLRYTWSASAAGAADCSLADAVEPTSVTLDGVPVDAAATYRVTVNNFLADGGDGFAVLPTGTDRVGGGEDLDAFESYLAATGPVAPPALDRITVVP